MGQFQRFINQVTYDISRKRAYAKRKKGGTHRPKVNVSMMRTSRTAKVKPHFAVIQNGESIKKWIGLLLIVVGMVLIFTKCAGGLSAKENQEDTKEVSKIQQQNSSYTDYVQDFNIGGDPLTELLELSLKYKKDYAHTLAVWAVESYKGTPLSRIKQNIKVKNRSSFSDEFGMYDYATQIYKQFIYDIKCFPILEKGEYTYENGWKQSRNYNGNRLHYGIDLMSKSNEAGTIKVRSMTDGRVENIGWNQMGGYRVGIRSKGGAYFYYAHLDSYAEGLVQGDVVQAGQMIGFMGDTGYGEEGTRGKFPVHLHVGIAVKTPHHIELWINPYSVLKYLEQR